jgi:HAMP domain-containing protein
MGFRGRRCVKLVVKFNLVFAIVFFVGMVGAGYVSRTILERNAREETLENASLIMESAMAARSYTEDSVAPLLKRQTDEEFLPPTVPAFAATEQFSALHARFPDFSYKEATLNPTNPRDRATDWETDIVDRFRQFHEVEISGERDTPNGRSQYLARPIQIHDPACLQCHSTVEAAPKPLIRRYGPANGFGWKLDEIVGAQIVSVPTVHAQKRAERAFHTFMMALALLFVGVFAPLNVLIHVLVVAPVTRLARAADEVSLGKMEAADFPTPGSDEVSLLAHSFNRMKKSLIRAIKMLEQ